MPRRSQAKPKEEEYTLEALKAEPKAPMAKCHECPLWAEKCVPGKGPDKAQLVVVGEAPGEQEARSKVPFSGKSGKLLDRILAYHGIRREDVFVTNTVLCRPPENRTPTAKEVRACQDRLRWEVSSRGPETVLALGNSAAQSLIGTRDGITRLRTGNGYQSAILDDGVRVVPTYHPAAALRSSDLFPSIVRDVGKIVHVAVGFEATQHEVIEDPYLASQELERLSRFPVLTCDIEASVPDFKRYDAKHPMWLCLGITGEEGRATVFSREVVYDPMFRHRAAQLFADPNIRWNWQNGKFDIQPLWEFAPGARVDSDTMLASYACDERKGIHSLEQLAVERLNAPYYKMESKEYLADSDVKDFAHLPPDVLHRRNAMDVDVTHRLLPILEKEMKDDGVYDMYQTLLVAGSNALARVEYRGVRVDIPRLIEVEAEVLADRERALRECQKWVKNPNSPKQVREAFFEEADIYLEDTRKETLAELEHELAGKILDYRHWQKLLSTYVRGLARHVLRGRVHATFNLHVAENGRLSCRRPNLQNIPTGSYIRDIFMASAGKMLLSADYDQIEFRNAAILSGDEWLLNQFRSGRKFHKEVARQYFGPSYTDLQYLRAKARNFGILYLRGARSLADEYGTSIADEQAYINGFYKQMPGVKAYQDDIIRQIKSNGYLTSYFGRKRRFWLVTRDNWHEVSKEGVNFPLSSTASDFTLLSLIRLEPMLRGTATPVITVHDQLVWEVPEDPEGLEYCARTIKEVMEDTPVAHICPTPVEMSVARRWGELKSELNKYEVRT
jgi:uracil-DNA glycosylase family 4